MKWWAGLAAVALSVDEIVEGDQFFIAGLVVSVALGFAYGFLRGVGRDVLARRRLHDLVMAEAAFLYPDDILEMRSSLWRNEIVMVIDGGDKWANFPD
jgi:hypothetical protein